MGCGSGLRSEGEMFQDNYLEKNELFNRAEDLIDELEYGVNQYEKFKKDYEEILSLKIKTENDLNTYFNIDYNFDITYEKGYIFKMDEVFDKVYKIHEMLQVNPQALNIQTTEKQEERGVNKENQKGNIKDKKVK